MADFKIRFNNEHKASELKWIVLIDGEEFKAKNVIINNKSKTTEDWVTSDSNTQFIKHHVSLSSDVWSWSKDKTLTIS